MDVNVLSRLDGVTKDFQIKKQNIQIHYFAKKKPKIISSLVRDLPALKKKIEDINPDILHAQSADAAYPALIARCPTVMTLHGIVWKEMKFHSGIKNFGTRIIHQYLTKYVLKKLKHFIIINPYIDEEVGCMTNAKKYFINNPIEDQFFKLQNKEVYGSIFYLGVINPRKDLFTLIKAIPIIQEQIPEAHLRIAGKIADKEFYDNIMDYVRNTNINGINFLGRLGDKEIEDEYRTCSLFCLPSRQETAPMVISEAMAAGKPVVTSNICGMPYMVIDDVTGYLFEPGDVQSLAEKIIKLLKNDALRHQMGLRAHQVAKEQFSAEIVAKKTIDAYKDILSIG